VSSAYGAVAGGFMNSANGMMAFATGTYAQVVDNYAAAFGFSGENCYSMGESTVNMCTKTEGLYHNGIKLNSIAYTNDNQSPLLSVLAGGSDNTVMKDYAALGGGQYNTIKGMYGSVPGGYKNRVVSNYGTITGGFMNVVRGRHGAVIGGSRNTVQGRYSLAMGFRAEATQDLAGSMGFSSYICTGRMEKDLNICSESFMINDLDVGSILSRRQLQESATEEGAKIVARQEKTLAEMAKRDAEQDALVQEQSKALADLKAQLAVLLSSRASE